MVKELPEMANRVPPFEWAINAVDRISDGEKESKSLIINS
jgi:hypothetical protein